MEVTDEVGWRKGMAGPQGAVLGIDSTPRHEVMEFSSPFLFFILHKTSYLLLLAR